MNKLEKYSVSVNITLEDAMSKMVTEGVKTLVVLKGKHLFGTLSDGDIRKLILKKYKLKKKIKNIVFRSPLFLKTNFKRNDAKKIFIQNGFDLLPVVDEKKVLQDVITWTELFDLNKVNYQKSKIKDIPVLIMAGGLGTRLLPFTNIIPKPLMPYKNKSIIENVIDQFKYYSVKNIYISINFKANLIKAYLDQVVNQNENISLIKENQKLGTCGPLKKIRKNFKNIIVTNCDTIIDLDFNDLYEFHTKSKSLMTIVSANKKITVPYGICKTNSAGRLHSFQEKPSFSYLANVGLYVINKKLLKLIPSKKQFDMDNLIYLMLNKKFKISTFPISDSQWIDVGQFKNIKQPNE